jgi:lipoprotein-anchoring transpeptidase ErfK/SrfK
VSAVTAVIASSLTAAATILCVTLASVRAADNIVTAPIMMDAIASQDIVTRDDQTAGAATRVAQFLPWWLEGRPAPWAQPRPRQQPQRYEERRWRDEQRSYQRRDDEGRSRWSTDTSTNSPSSTVPWFDDNRGNRRWSSGDDTTARSSRSRKNARNAAPPETHKDRILAQLRDPPVIPPTRGPLLLAVSIGKQTVTLFDGGVPVVKAPVSTGTESRPTPMGVFSVVEKNWWHRSNMYSAAPMPFMQRITWSGVALHAGELPGYRASHGCVRLPEAFALRLWYTTKVGVRVIIAWDEVTPADINHRLLFQPKPRLQEPLQQQQPRPTDPDDAQVSLNTPSQDDPRDQGEPVNVWSPVLAAAGAPEQTAANAGGDPVVEHMMMAAVDDGDRANDNAVASAEPLDPADATHRSVAFALSRPQQRSALVTLERDLPPINEPSRGQARPELPVTLAKLVMEDTPEGARPPAIIDSLTTARSNASRQRRVADAAAPAPAPERVLRPGPISILISRQDRRLYVRKGLEPVFDAPITIAEQWRPMGVHVFQAVAANDSNTRLRWMVVSPSETTREAASPRRRSRWAEPAAAPAVISTAAASAVLDRIGMSPATSDRVSELVSAGATIIVSDIGLGRTAAVPDSDFTVLLDGSDALGRDTTTYSNRSNNGSYGRSYNGTYSYDRGTYGYDRRSSLGRY